MLDGNQKIFWNNAPKTSATNLNINTKEIHDCSKRAMESHQTVFAPEAARKSSY
ncbi:hypothetical protein OH492_06455 [Vibrio chagasii]|nr:hypothetical protein [Vibrio chagasii]